MFYLKLVEDIFIIQKNQADAQLQLRRLQARQISCFQAIK